MSDYKKECLQELIKRYNQRKLKGIETTRKISIAPSFLLKNYNKPTVQLEAFEEVNRELGKLEELHFVKVREVPHQTAIQEIILNTDQVSRIESWLKDVYGLMPDAEIRGDILHFLEQYSGDTLAGYYAAKLKDSLSKKALLEAKEREKSLLSYLSFLDQNKDDLYLRETSMLVYGTSKYLEEQTKNQICGIIREYLKEHGEAISDNDDELLERFHVYSTEQETKIKGNIRITLKSGHEIDVSEFPNGISVSSNDADILKKIQINCPAFITIENKTAFQRFQNGEMAALYLGGFANRHQIQLIRHIAIDNPNLKYYHFGDLDVGGFRIHKNLCEATGLTFAMYAMGIEELSDSRYQRCLQPLTENDRQNMETLLQYPLYEDTLRYMLANDCKLEQEIVGMYEANDRVRQAYLRNR